MGGLLVIGGVMLKDMMAFQVPIFPPFPILGQEVSFFLLSYVPALPQNQRQQVKPTMGEKKIPKL